MRSTPPFFPLYPMSYISYFGSTVASAHYACTCMHACCTFLYLRFIIVRVCAHARARTPTSCLPPFDLQSQSAVVYNT